MSKLLLGMSSCPESFADWELPKLSEGFWANARLTERRVATKVARKVGNRIIKLSLKGAQYVAHIHMVTVKMAAS